MYRYQYSPSGVLGLRDVIPTHVPNGWKTFTGEDMFVEAAACRKLQVRRWLTGVASLVVCVLFALGLAWSMPRLPVDRSFDLTSFIYFGSLAGAICTGIGALWLLVSRPGRVDKFESWHSGVGRNLRDLCDYLGVSPKELRGINLLAKATEVLDKKAREFVVTERALLMGIGRRLKREDWKFDPKWNEARDAFSYCYEVMQVFCLVEPVDDPRDAWKPYITRAETTLASEENALGA